MNDRNQLFEEAMALMKNATPQKESILYHNIHSLQVNGGYPFSSRQEVRELVKFLNACD